MYSSVELRRTWAGLQDTMREQVEALAWELVKRGPAASLAANETTVRVWDVNSPITPLRSDRPFFLSQELQTWLLTPGASGGCPVKPKDLNDAIKVLNKDYNGLAYGLAAFITRSWNEGEYFHLPWSFIFNPTPRTPLNLGPGDVRARWYCYSMVEGACLQPKAPHPCSIKCYGRQAPIERNITLRNILVVVADAHDIALFLHTAHDPDYPPLLIQPSELVQALQ